jgi:hypothetical protein
VIGYEAWIIQKLRRDIIDFQSALQVSLIANAASFLVGLFFLLWVVPNI